MRKINVRSPYYIEVAPKPEIIYYYSLQKCEDSSIGYVSEQTADEISLDNDDRVQDASLNDYVVLGKVDITQGTYTSVGLVTDTGETGCIVPPDPVYYSLIKCSDSSTGYISAQETSEITLADGARVQDSNNNYYTVSGDSETGVSVGNVTATGNQGCPTITPPIAPQTIDVECGGTHNVATDVGVVTYKLDTSNIGTVSVDITGSDVPAKFTLKWDGNESTTDYIGLDTYDQDLLDAGVPIGEIATSNPSTKASNSVSINKASSLPRSVELVVNAPLINDDYTVEFNCPAPPPVTIENTTQINIWFDNSGSMDQTLAPLQDMVAGNLKSCLVGFYNDDSAEYDKYVKVRTMGKYPNNLTERTFYYAAQQPSVIGATNVINIIFQDEADPIYHERNFDFNPNVPPTPTFISDMSVLKYNLANNSTGYITPIIFQVAGFQRFKSFLEAVETGIGAYTPDEYNLRFSPSVKFYYDVQNGVSYASDPTYYRNFIVQAINDLGFSLTCS